MHANKAISRRRKKVSFVPLYAFCRWWIATLCGKVENKKRELISSVL